MISIVHGPVYQCIGSHSRTALVLLRYDIVYTWGACDVKRTVSALNIIYSRFIHWHGLYESDKFRKKKNHYGDSGPRIVHPHVAICGNSQKFSWMLD